MDPSGATRVLIVEDLITDAELAEREVRRVLRETTFLRVDTEDDFLKALKSFEPDVILSDYRLPLFDGLTALQLALKHVPDTPFIVITGSMNEETAVDCMRRGAWDYVIKEHVKRLGPAVLGALEQKKVRFERKTAEDALANEAVRRRILIEHSRDGIVILDQNGGVYEANRRFGEMLGYSQAELRELHVWDWEFLTPKEGLVEMLGAVDEVGVNFETRHRRKDGTIYDVEISANGAEFSGQKLTFCVCRDITGRKKAEAETERLRAAIEQAGEMVMITDLEGEILYVNPAFERVTGYSRLEVAGQNARFLKSGEQDETFYRDLWATIGNGRTWTGRMVNRRKDGSLFSEAMTISPVRDSSGCITNYVAVMRDITEQIRLTEQLQQAQKMESVGRLAGGVAHDYNNVLSVILGYVELAMHEVDPSTMLYGNLREVLGAARRSADITRQLLAFARKQTISPKTLDLNETIEGMLKMLRRLIGEDIDLLWLPKARLWPVKMDPSQLDQILANLCVNARDAIADVGKITIETDNVTFDEAYCLQHPGSIPGDYALLALTDTGSGMDKETLARVFEPFFTTKAQGRGTGLGLATVYGIVKQNDGFVNVYSEPGEGTIFKIYLPRDMGTVAVPPEETETPLPRGLGETVLVVEDDEAILRLAEKFLQDLGYTVLIADSPSKAISLAASYAGEIHLLMTDVVMPGMNGKELCEKLKAARPSVRCLFMSGYTANVIAHRGVLEEGVLFLSKPFSLRQLATKVRETMDR